MDDTSHDVANCGGCGLRCGPYDHAAAACVGGACVVGECNAGFADCDRTSNNGCETSVETDVDHCGNCGTSCRVGTNATPTCTGGRCGGTCAGGFADCNSNIGDGCETSISTDALNCGGCGNTCGQLPHATAVACVMGACKASACSGWFGDCDGDPANGCEANTEVDPQHCGGCGACPVPAQGTAGCVLGACTVDRCQPGFGNCDGNPSNGCETGTSSDVNNCGVCGGVCAGLHSQQSCVNGACVIAQCQQGFADCDGKAGSGCEVNLMDDVMNCNGCGKSCPVPPHTIAACRQGVCAVVGCAPNFGDCNKDPIDGCEVGLLTPMNCGACGVPCMADHAFPFCDAGKCTIGACAPGWGDCNKSFQDGCETDLTNYQNCGICGLSCGPWNECKNGKCYVCCDGFGRVECGASPGKCDGQCVYPSSDPKNCGACGVVCPQQKPNCFQGMCQ